MQTALVFGGLTIVLCSLASLALGSLMTSEIRHDSARSLESMTQTAAQTLATGLSQRLREARVLAESAPLWTDGLDSPGVRQALARAQAAQQHNAWIGVADKTGRVMAATSDLLLGASVAERPWFIAGQEGLHVGDVHRALLLERLLPKDQSGEPIRFVDFSAPVKVDGKVVGVVGMHGTWDWARDVVTSLMPADALARGLEVYIFDRKGRLLYSPREAPASAARPLELDELHPVAENGAPLAENRPTEIVQWPDGQTYLTARFALPAHEAVSDLGWQIVAREPTARAFARAQAALQIAFCVGVGIAAVAGWLAWLAAGMLGRPLERLARAALEVQRHVPGAQVPLLHANREVQSLSRALAGMSERLSATYRAAPVGMCQLDLDGKVLDANDRLCELLRVPVQSLLSRRLADLIGKRDQARLVCALDDLARRHGGKASVESSIARVAGGELQVILSVSLVPATESTSEYFVVAMEDLSQQIAAEAASRASAAKSAFLSQVSHELRTPLNAVLGFSHLLRIDETESLGPKQAQRVDAIYDAGHHLLSMIDDLLDITQVEGDRLSVTPEPVLVQETVDQSIRLVSEAAVRSGVTLVVRPPADALASCVRADRLRLRQATLNLLSNAIKYNRKGGTVTVDWHATADGKRIELSISDTGPGMDASKLAQLFQPFNRLGEENSSIQGTGLGLVITSKLIALMDGKLLVSSEPGTGSRFSISLPVAKRQAAAAMAPSPTPSLERTAPPQARPQPAAGKKRVLYVEDNVVNVELMKGVLALRPDIELSIACSGGEALAMSLADPPDMLLIDMHLGDMTGIELCARLRLHSRFSGIPMISVSADAMPDAISEAGEAGFADYVTKPIDIEKLFNTLDAAFARFA